MKQSQQNMKSMHIRQMFMEYPDLDVLVLNSGRVIGIDTESVCMYDDIDKLYECEATSCLTLSSGQVSAPEHGVPYEDAFTEAVRFIERVQRYILNEADVNIRILFKNLLTKENEIWSYTMNIHDAVIKFITENVGKTTHICYRSCDDEYHQLVFFNYVDDHIRDCYILAAKKVY